jgi:DNA-binding HxlR family transcriptional regulator
MATTTPPRRDHCPIARSLELLGDRWTLLALREVFYGNCRFQGLVARTGAPRDILANRLVRLVEAGLLHRSPYNAAGTRFEYELTPQGLATRPILAALGDFGETVLPDSLGPTHWRDFTPRVHREAPPARPSRAGSVVGTSNEAGVGAEGIEPPTTSL